MIVGGKIQAGTEVFICTDNAVAESTYFKGSSKSRELHDMIVELRKLEMKGLLIIHFIWISGRRMIQHGTDGLSRGDTGSGVMEGKDFLDVLPLNETALDRQPRLREQILDWVTDSTQWKFASTEDWFDRVLHEPKGAWIWTPPPCLARIAVEQLCEVKHIYPKSKHIFVCPALMTGYWRKPLGKISDIMFTVKAGCKLWDDAMLEPLTIAFASPLLSRSPWVAGRLERLESWESRLPVLQWSSGSSFGYHLRKFWNLSREEPGALPGSLAC
jgi:hypothetical protein